MNGEVLHVGQRTTENIDLIDYCKKKKYVDDSKTKEMFLRVKEKKNSSMNS